eukprot:Nk52_evm12s2426 gene=Nk52_evmTU12s2426
MRRTPTDFAPLSRRAGWSMGKWILGAILLALAVGFVLHMVKHKKDAKEPISPDGGGDDHGTVIEEESTGGQGGGNETGTEGEEGNSHQTNSSKPGNSSETDKDSGAGKDHEASEGGETKPAPTKEECDSTLCSIKQSLQSVGETVSKAVAPLFPWNWF